ncbi:LRR receptor-like serine/threonine-protein kinase GSO2 [Malus sylvestris]|uniref:LRR receptor-like serine/threonine-protein kinase GSO2 n=1 Tax=Malus sylvestris TaxID=3752 RepID=UPI0021AC5901|nr:LRR receptor-like serine/threonine-protein kinase GSO2 [Malus sylvestris]
MLNVLGSVVREEKEWPNKFTPPTATSPTSQVVYSFKASTPPTPSFSLCHDIPIFSLGFLDMSGKDFEETGSEGDADADDEDEETKTHRSSSGRRGGRFDGGGGAFVTPSAREGEEKISTVHSLANGPIPNPNTTVVKCARDEGEGADSVNPKSESSIRSASSQIGDSLRTGAVYYRIVDLDRTDPDPHTIAVVSMEEDGEIQSPASGGSRSPASTRQNGRITVTVAVPPAQVPASNRPTTWTSSIGMLKRLQTVALYTSLLSGSIPEEIGNYSELQNYLVGSIPSELGSCREVTVMDFSENLLAGQIPKSFGELSNLQELQFECQSVISLQGLDLPYNNLFGSIPRNVFGLQNLTKLLLLSNDLSGLIPPDIGNCTNLYRLRLNHNRLSGTVPLEIGNLKSLNFVDLSNNRLVGEIPPSISGCQNLEYLDHHSNGITGSVPGTLPKSLQFVDISDNRLTGQLPHSIGSLTELTKLNLEKNQLSGSIPAEILSCNKPQPLHMVRTPGTSGPLRQLHDLPKTPSPPSPRSSLPCSWVITH